VINELGDGVKALVVAGIAPGKVLFLKRPCFRPSLDQSDRLDRELVRGRITRQAPNQNATGAWIPVSVVSVGHLEFLVDVTGIVAADGVIDTLCRALFGI